jgi:hypothetical protein
MRKSECVNLLARRLGLRATRLTNLVQRLAEADLLPTASGPPYPDLSPIEISRMLLVGICDEGLGAAPSTIEKYGGLRGPGATLEETLGHTLMRPDSLVPASSSLEVHTGDEPYAVLTVITADGARSLVFGGMPDVETVDRIVNVSGAVLFAIAAEIAGKSPADVDQMLAGAEQVQKRSEAVAA